MPHRRSSLDENFGTRLAFAIFDLLATNSHLNRIRFGSSFSMMLSSVCFLFVITLERQADQIQ